MKTIKETLKLALEGVLVGFKSEQYMKDADYLLQDQAVQALKEALAQEHSSDEQPAPVAKPHEQEPVAWLIDNGGDAVLIRHSENFPGVFAGSEFRKQPLVYGDKSPPAQRKPLTLWTEAQHERAYRNSPDLHKDVKSLAAFKRVAKEIAVMYGITAAPQLKENA